MNWIHLALFVFLISIRYSNGKSLDKIPTLVTDDLVTSFKNLHISPKVEIEPLSTSGAIRVGKIFDYGQNSPKKSSSPVPGPVQISSQSIKIKGNREKLKKNHGVQKRQIIVQDASHILRGAQESSQQQVFYAPQAQQSQQQYFTHNGAIYASPSPPIQIQTVTPVPYQSTNQQMFIHGQNSHFFTRTGEIGQNNENTHPQPQVTIVNHATPHDISKDKKIAEEPVKTQQQIQYEEAQRVLQQVIQAQQMQAQQQALQQQAAAQAVEEQQKIVAKAHSENQQTQTILLPQGASTLIQAQVQPDQSVAKIFHLPQNTPNVQNLPQQQHQVQQTQPQIAIQPQIQHQIQNSQVISSQPSQTVVQGANGQTYIIHHNSPPPVPQPHIEPHVEEKNSNGFVIKHQTYVAGPGGQMFTVPVPIPADEENNSEENNSRENHSREEHAHNRIRERNDEKNHKNTHNNRENYSFMKRVMDAFSVRGNAMERMETNIALPILASTGVFFGLGALAAGWYLSNANREVGILRRTGTVPAGTPNIKRIRRAAPEVDQATFFQTIIQQAIEKQQKEYDTPETSVSQVVETKSPVYHKSKHSKSSKNKHVVAHSRNDYQDETYQTPADSKVAKKPRRGGLFSRETLNFARVAIPAVVLGGAVIAIGALIFGWYITGSNREIAFLEPSAYSRKKRDLGEEEHRILNSVHESPFDDSNLGGSKKSNFEYHANLSDAVVAVSLAVVAFFSLLGIVLAWLFAENEKSLHGISGPYGFGGFPNGHYRSNKRFRRDLGGNELNSGNFGANDPNFLESILSNLEVSENSFLRKLKNIGYSKWEETPCAKRIFCDVMSAQGDDTVRGIEKKMLTFISMLPETLSTPLKKSLGEVMLRISRRDCSAYTCGGHWVDSSQINQPANQNQPR